MSPVFEWLHRNLHKYIDNETRFKIMSFFQKPAHSSTASLLSIWKVSYGFSNPVLNLASNVKYMLLYNQTLAQSLHYLNCQAHKCSSVKRALREALIVHELQALISPDYPCLSGEKHIFMADHLNHHHGRKKAQCVV